MAKIYNISTKLATINPTYGNKPLKDIALAKQQLQITIIDKMNQAEH